jgi:XRE family transcriptional regulator, master regulator for biofilm formation
MIGKKIKEMRKKKGYSITELAKLADVSKSYLSQIERGLQGNPSLQFLRKIAFPLGTSIEHLLQGEILSNLTVCELDNEWKTLIKKAIDDGLEKEDFKEYINYLKFQAWMKDKSK